jgi:hypothetical protein
VKSNIRKHSCAQSRKWCTAICSTLAASKVDPQILDFSEKNCQKLTLEPVFDVAVGVEEYKKFIASSPGNVCKVSPKNFQLM